MAPVHRHARAQGVLVATILGVALSGCSLVGASEKPESGKDVVLVTHDSFALPKSLIARFDQQSGYHLLVHAAGDGGTLTNKLVLTQDDPTGDVAFGVDNTFASRALDADVFAKSDVPLPPGAEQYVVPGDDGRLAPIDNGNVCVNIDTGWFADHHVAPPQSLDDLVKPAYDGLIAVPGATTSSTGLAFLLGTIGRYGDGWSAWWQKLVANGATITEGWTQAYETEFTQGGGHGHDPIVVSYDSSPAFTVPKGGSSSTTKALLDTCFRQIEYAGVLTGAANPEGAKAFVEFLLSPTVQKALPDAMYVFPVRQGTPLPTAWARFAVQPRHPYAVSPADISAHRDAWLREWSDIVSR
ncbi:MAG TPA: thiamine ABC transporter substrate-binding protein [Nocardioides sp.]|jgi:thiamine transport system substrate-binding protein|nr:thiamine ABC transporter substrate-binding protein [Nocardioides sp.]